MVDFLTCFIFNPFIQSFKLIFDVIDTFVSNTGYSLLIFAFVVSIVIHPIEKAARIISKQEKNIQSIISVQLKKIKIQYKGEQKDQAIKRLYKRYSYSPLLSFRASLDVLVQFPFLFVAYYMLKDNPKLIQHSFYFIKDLGQPDSLLIGYNLLPIIMTVVNIYTAIVLRIKGLQLAQSIIIALAFFIFLYSAPSGLLLYWTTNNFLHLLRALKSRFSKRSYGKNNFDIKNLIVKFYSNTVPKINISNAIGYISGLLSITIIFLYYPLRIFKSDIFAFTGHSIDNILNEQIELYFSIFILYNLVYFAFKSKFINLLLSVFVIICIIYGFILPNDYGAIDGLSLQKAELLSKKKWLKRVCDLSVVLFVLYFLYFLSKYKKLSFIKSLLFFATFFIVGSTSYYYVNISNQIKAYQIKKITKNVIKAYQIKKITKNDILYSNDEIASHFFSLSKNGKNIVVIMLDMFTGDHVELITKQEPSLINKLSGFVWYKDSISSGSHTVIGKAPILGGYSLHPLSIKNSEKKESLEKVVNKSWNELFVKLLDKGFQVNISEQDWLDYNYLKKEIGSRDVIIGDKRILSSLVKKYQDIHNISIKNNYKTKYVLSSMSLFYLMPYSIKNRIYDNGSWFGSFADGSVNIKNLIDNSNSYGMLEQIPSFSNIKNDLNSFIYFSSVVTHLPWSLDSDCNTEFLKDRDQKYRAMYGKPYKFGPMPRHVNNEKCALRALSSWFDWMKRNGVYDNTKIIIVSDHGYGDDIKPVLNPSRLYNGYSVHLGSLLMVKEFYQNGDLRIDEKTKTANWDVRDIILDSEYLTNLQNNQNRVRCSILGGLNRANHKENEYIIKYKLCTNGDSRDSKTWTLTQPK